MHTDTYNEYGLHVTWWDYDCTLTLVRDPPSPPYTHKHSYTNIFNLSVEGKVTGMLSRSVGVIIM